MGKWILFACCLFCALLYGGFGVAAGRKKTPMHFWSGEKVPSAAIRDVPAYNRAMRRMYCAFAVPYLLSALLALPGGGWIWASAGLLTLASIGGIGVLSYAYSRIEEKYKI